MSTASFYVKKQENCWKRKGTTALQNVYKKPFGWEVSETMKMGNCQESAVHPTLRRPSFNMGVCSKLQSIARYAGTNRYQF